MTRAPAAPRTRRPARGATAALALLLALPGVLAAQRGAATGPEGCELCHGELEFLRQRVPGLARARELLVPRATVERSAHGGMSCGGCHEGFERFPHPRPGARAGPTTVDAPSTRSCAACHEEVEDAWRGSIHEREDEGADCAACHGVHGALAADELALADGALRMNASCVECHDTSALPVGDPHADSVPCWSCHGPHDTDAVAAATSRVAPPAQPATCGACHGGVADRASADVHGEGLRDAGIRTLAMLAHEGSDAPPACTSCHGSHGMLRTGASGFGQGVVARCSACHEHYAETFDDTYHGQATALGSEAVAACQDCHGAHGVYPASDARSTVSGERLLETCRSCHPTATAGFASFQPHADPHDREGYPAVYWVYTLMTALLIGVFTFFGTHTALWLARLGRDALGRGRQGG